MKNKLLKLCKRMNKITIDEILPILSMTKAEILPLIEELVQENKIDKRGDGIYFYREEQRKSSLPLFFECRTSNEVQLIKRCFCADLPCTQTGIILNLSDEIVGKFNKYFREFIYNIQLSELIEKYNNKPQIPRMRNFFDIPVYFYYYDNLTYVSAKKLISTNVEQQYKASEVREFKKSYLKIRRRIYHHEMKSFLSHHVAEAILRTYMSFDEMLEFIS